MKNQFTFIDLFAGIGGFHLACVQNGGNCVFASEIDIYAKDAYFANYGLLSRGDIAAIDASAIPDHDMLCAGFPCQPFSIIGNRQGFDDMRGTLFFEIIRILQGKKPPMIVLENVKQLSTHNRGHTITRIIEALNELGYKTYRTILNALNYGLPQKRERTIIVGFLDHNVNFCWPHKLDKYKSLSEILESVVDEK